MAARTADPAPAATGFAAAPKGGKRALEWASGVETRAYPTCTTRPNAFNVPDNFAGG